MLCKISDHPPVSCHTNVGEYEAGEIKFRENFVSQIKHLIGHYPRLENRGEGFFAIYYE